MKNTIELPQRNKELSEKVDKTLQILQKMVKIGHAREEREFHDDYEIFSYFLEKEK